MTNGLYFPPSLKLIFLDNNVFRFVLWNFCIRTIFCWEESNLRMLFWVPLPLTSISSLPPLTKYFQTEKDMSTLLTSISQNGLNRENLQAPFVALPSKLLAVSYHWLVFNYPHLIQIFGTRSPSRKWILLPLRHLDFRDSLVWVDRWAATLL